MISVIIPTYNEKENLGGCLESLGAQNYADFEIVVVDDGSRDGTLSLLKNLKRTIPNFKFIKINHKGPGAARNSGAKIAKGKILVFVDADMTFDPDFLTKLVAPIEKGEVLGTFSKEEYVGNWENVWAKCWNIEEGWEPKRRHPKNYPDHEPVFRAILKSEFDKVHGFTPGGYMDDWSLSTKLGYEAINAPDAVYYHTNPSGLKEIFFQAKWVAKRKYKLGFLGYIAALVRSFFIISIAVGIYKSVVHKQPSFVLFKLIYDFGIFVGIWEMLLTGKKMK